MSASLGLRLFTVSSALFVIASIAPAQTKVAVINLQRAVLDSAEIKKASAQMEAKYKPRQAGMEKLLKEIEGIRQNLQTNAGKLTPQAEQDLTLQGQRKQKEYQRMDEDLRAEVESERREILSASTQKMTDLVKKLAEEKGYDVVVDVTNTIFYKPALEITNEALAAYDKAHPAN